MLLVIIPGSILLITFVRKQKEPALVGAVTTPVQPTVISGTQNSEQSQQQTPVQPPQNPTIQTPPSTPAAFDPFKPASEPQRSTPPQSNTQPTPSAPVPAPQPPEQPQPPQEQPSTSILLAPEALAMLCPNHRNTQKARKAQTNTGNARLQGLQEHGRRRRRLR